MFNRGKCIHGSCITLPWQINEEVKMLIQGSYFIRDLIFKNDPHIILKLAIPQCTTKILKIFLTHQVIIPNKIDEYILNLQSTIGRLSIIINKKLRKSC